jgi:hypothetical protein
LWPSLNIFPRLATDPFRIKHLINERFFKNPLARFIVPHILTAASETAVTEGRSWGNASRRLARGINSGKAGTKARSEKLKKAVDGFGKVANIGGHKFNCSLIASRAYRW